MPSSSTALHKYMGGVDLNDQLRGYYSLRMKCRKYYKYIFWFLVDLAITNAYILCKNHTHLNILSTKTFRLELTKSLIRSYSSRKRPGRPSLTPIPKRFKVADHFLAKEWRKVKRRATSVVIVGHSTTEEGRRSGIVTHATSFFATQGEKTTASLSITSSISNKQKKCVCERERERLQTYLILSISLPLTVSVSCVCAYTCVHITMCMYLTIMTFIPLTKSSIFTSHDL